MNKNAIITGAAGNLGKVVTQRLLDEGYNVFAAISEHDDQKFISHANLMVTSIDLTSEESASKFVKEITETQNIDLALLIVGGFAVGDIRTTGKQEMDQMYRVNFETAYNIVRPVFMEMESQETGGQIIMIGSRSALEAEEGKNYVAYALTKAILFNLSEIVNAEGKGKNITSSIIVPSTIDTPGTRKAMPDANFNDWVSPAEIGDTVLHLCTPAGRKLRHSIFKIYGNA